MTVTSVLYASRNKGGIDGHLPMLCASRIQKGNVIGTIYRS